MTFVEGRIIKKFKIKKDLRVIEITIRNVKKIDAKKMMKHVNSIINEGAFVGGIGRVTLKEMKKSVNEYINACRSGKCISIVAETNNMLIGTAGGSLEKGVRSHVIDIGISIAKDYRSIGLGKRLMKVLINLAKNELKAEIMMLSVYNSNKVAINLYTVLGFKQVGKIKRGMKLRGKYYDNILMVLNL